MLVSGDRGLLCKEITELKSKFGAIARDWDPGAIAWVANNNHTNCLTLKGVTDFVGIAKGDTYDGNLSYYYENTEQIMKILIDS